MYIIIHEITSPKRRIIHIPLAQRSTSLPELWHRQLQPLLPLSPEEGKKMAEKLASFFPLERALVYVRSPHANIIIVRGFLWFNTRPQCQ